MIKAGEGKGFELLEEWADNDEIKREHKKFHDYLLKHI
jgi:hypothetical protein